MPTWITGGGIKIERAKKHVENLETEFKAFWKLYPDCIAKDRHKKTGDLVVFVHFTGTPEPEWGAMVGDALHNLRSGLNMLWGHVTANAGSPRRGASDFRIFDTSKAFEAMVKRKPKGRMADVMAILKTIKPYKGGNDALWMLHDLNNIDKHELVTVARSAVLKGEVIVNAPPAIARTGRHIRFGSTVATGAPFAGQEGTVLYSIPAEFVGKVQVQTKPFQAITFSEPKVVEGKEIVSTLAHLTSVVEGVVETFRLGGFVT